MGWKLTYRLTDTCEVVFVDRKRAQSLLRTEDDYTNTLTKFDLQAKVQTVREDVSVADYLENAGKYLYEWRQPEVDYLAKIINETRQLLANFNFTFELPQKINLIKSAMFEEGGARGFTRHNCIILNKNAYSSHLFEHELFHIISRYNPRMMEKAFNVLGFEKSNDIEMPCELEDLKISNPDAPMNNFYISVMSNDEPIDAVTLIYSKRSYTGGTFFSYLNKGLLRLSGAADSKVPYRNNAGSIELLGYEEVKGFYEKIGTNTGYNIHPEEITADHFSFILHRTEGLPNQHLVDNLAKVLQSR